MTSWLRQVRRTVLPNGLTVLAYRDPSSPAAAVITHVKAGFFDEPDEWQGVSHVLEHMFFKGTPSRGVGEIARQTKAAGGYLNAGTSYDYTVYYVVLPSDRVAQGMEIQADALQNSLIDAEELRRELQVIIQEAKRKRDTPGAVTTETLFEVLHDRHRIRRWRIGHEDRLAQLTRDDIAGYYRSRYRPGRVILSVVGEVDPEKVIDLAGKMYGDWSADAGAVERSPGEPPRRELRARTLVGDVAQAHLGLGWRTVDPLHPDSLPLEVAGTILGSGRGSWLQQSLRNSGIVSSVSAYQFAPTELGVFGVGASLEPDKVEAAVATVGAALRRLAFEGPSEDDIERARSVMLTRRARSIEPTDGRAASLAAAEALRDIELLDEEAARLEEVGRDDVVEAVGRWIDLDATGAVFYRRPGGEPLTATRLRELLSRDGSYRRPGPAPDSGPATPGSRRVKSSVRGPARHASLAGADLIAWHKPGMETASISVYYRRSGSDPIQQAGWGTLAVRSALRGAGPFDAARLALAMERLGGSLAARTGTDWFGLAASVAPDRLPEAAALMRLTLDHAKFEEEEVDREREVLLQECRRLEDDMVRYPLQLALRARFKDRGYGVPVGGTVESLSRVGAAAVRDHFSAMTASKPAVVVVGGADPEELLASVAGSFEDIGPPTAASPEDHEPPPLGDTEQVVVSRAKSQTAIAMVFPGPGRRDPTRYSAECWTAVASGLSGRLFEALREKRSLAYTVIASSWQRRNAGALISYIAMGPEREEEARGAMLAELEKFAREPVSAEELAGAISYLTGQRLVGRQTGDSIASEIADAWLNGEGLEELADPAAPYREVSATDVLEVAATCLTDSRVEAVVRGAGA